MLLQIVDVDRGEGERVHDRVAWYLVSVIIENDKVTPVISKHETRNVMSHSFPVVLCSPTVHDGSV